jgi:hypothetical protein
MKIEFTKDEANALLFLLDAAVKAIGLRAAGDTYILARRIEEALQAESQPEPLQEAAE